MQFRNFPEELPAIKEKSNSIVRNFQAEWKKHIIREITTVLPLDKLSPEDDLTVMALFRILQRYYSERGKDGFDDIVKLWSYLINKEEEMKELIENPH